MLEKNVSHLFQKLATLTLVFFSVSSWCEKKISYVESSAIPVKILAVSDLIVDKYDTFLAEINATNRAKLSFQVGGQVQKLLVRMGQRVKKDQLLASLDPKDLQLNLDAANAEFLLARSQWKRTKNLFSQKLISADEYEQRETSFQAVLSKFEQAKTDLSFTQILAPFDGIVSFTFVKPFQIINPKEEILSIINNDSLDVSLSLPVAFVEKNTLVSLNNTDIWVVMDNEPNNKIKANFKEIATRPSRDINSYRASVSIKRPKNKNILTGMTGQVFIARQELSTQIFLPESAWVSKDKGQGEVWVMDPQTNKVNKVTLQLNENGSVSAGLNDADFVVIAGVERLIEDQEVKAWVREEGI